MNIIKLEEMLKQFFNEDLGDGDLSSEFIFSADQLGSFSFYAKESGIFAGHSLLSMAFSYSIDQSKSTFIKKMERWLSQVMCLL